MTGTRLQPAREPGATKASEKEFQGHTQRGLELRDLRRRVAKALLGVPTVHEYSDARAAHILRCLVNASRHIMNRSESGVSRTWRTGEASKA